MIKRKILYHICAVLILTSSMSTLGIKHSRQQNPFTFQASALASVNRAALGLNSFIRELSGEQSDVPLRQSRQGRQGREEEMGSGGGILAYHMPAGAESLKIFMLALLALFGLKAAGAENIFAVKRKNKHRLLKEYIHRSLEFLTLPEMLLKKLSDRYDVVPFEITFIVNQPRTAECGFFNDWRKK